MLDVIHGFQKKHCHKGLSDKEDQTAHSVKPQHHRSDQDTDQYPDRYDDVVVLRSERFGLLYRSVLCGSVSFGNRELHRALRTELSP